MGKYRRHKERANRALLLAAFVVVIFLISATLIYTDAFGIRTNLFGTQETIDTETHGGKTPDNKAGSGSWSYDGKSDQGAYFNDPMVGDQYWILTGQSTDLVGDAQFEIFDKKQYVLGWQELEGGSHVSETLSVDPQFGITGVMGYGVDWYTYRIQISDNGNTWTTIRARNVDTGAVARESRSVQKWDGPDISAGQQWYPMSAYNFDLAGDVSASLIRVQVKLQFKDFNIFTDDPAIWAYDTARLLKGDADITRQPDDDGDYVYTAGVDTVEWTIGTEYSGRSTGEPGNGWTVTLKNPNENTVETWTGDEIQDNKNNEIDWKIPLSAYKSTWSNIYTLTVKNGINEYDTKKIVTVDNESLIPSEPDISFRESSYIVGDTVAVTLSAEPNEVTQNNIQRFYVDVYYRDTEATIDPYDSYPVSASDNTTSFTFTPTRGHVAVVVKARANDGERTGPEGTGSTYIYRRGEQEIKGGPGQRLHFEIDTTTPDFTIIDKWAGLSPTPELIIYKAINPRGKTVYRWTSRPDYVQSIGTSNWRIKDNTSFTVPAWPSTGNWRIHYTVTDQRLWGLYSQPITEGNKPFEVKEGGTAQNLLAPMYLHWSGLFGTLNVDQNIGPPILWIGIAIGIVALAGYIYYRREKFLKWVRRGGGRGGSRSRGKGP